MTFEIRYLAEVPNAVARLAEIFVDEWEPYYGVEGPGDAERDIRACCRRGAVPIAVIAVDDGGDVIGTGALKAESLGSEPGQLPWIAGLVVEKNNRGKGVGTALVAALEDEARRLGFSSIYTSTDAADNILGKRGWRALKQVESLRGPVTVYRMDL
ncbi:MAG: GNAT family N-acetyltransferase [Kiloniellaceae bacterium]